MTRGVAALSGLIIGILDSIASAMPFWWFTVVTLGFGAFLVFFVPLVMYIMLGVGNKSEYLLSVCGKNIYVLMRIVGFIIGQIIGLVLASFLPKASLGLNGDSGWVVLLSYTGCMVLALVCARVFQRFVEK